MIAPARSPDPTLMLRINPAAARFEPMFGGDVREPLFEQRPAAAHIVGESVAAPEMAERGGRGDEGVVVAAERPIMFAGRPLVELGAEKGQREGQAHARQRFGKRDDVGVKPISSKLKKLPVRPQPA